MNFKYSLIEIPANTKIMTLPGLYSAKEQEITFLAPKQQFYVTNLLGIDFSETPNCVLELGSDFDETVLHLISLKNIEIGESIKIGFEFST